ncbi:polysaccharide deacetylase family protein [Tardiphaga sp.]|uniref:polysaccharide deacetylase family protein n=1 Tax=Tardiphaga sp. TaxID=1926292 RepID=UPI00262DDFDA|nr:polysaccharide deacetylase family protein [Tardiphaga sp.]
MSGRESVWIVLKTAIVALIASTVVSHAADCPRPDKGGTARVLAVDPTAYPRVGIQSFPQTLPLEDHEVVLTFDDGPNPATTSKILDALKAECMQATFFLIGQNASAHPALVKRIATEGHSIGHHTFAHPNLGHIDTASAIAQIDRGISADELALNGKATTVPATPFFRFPYFESTPVLLDMLQSRRIAVFGADFWASDWNKMTPAQELALVTGRLKAAGRGIVLFHDTKAQTAAMMPDFLRYLRENHYRVVHVVATAPGRTVQRAP